MVFGLFKSCSISDISFTLSFEDIKRKARIVVIDDQEEAFPYKLLQNEGYNIVYWPKIEKLKDLESGDFDIIVLDINGVATKEISANDGVGILEHLKKNNPAQIVIAYSGLQYDFSQASFWSLADDYLGKPSPLIACKEKIDRLLKEKFTPEYYWRNIENVLRDNNVSSKKIKNIEKIIVNSIRKKTDISQSRIADYLDIANKATSTVLTIAKIIIKLHGDQ